MYYKVIINSLINFLIIFIITVISTIFIIQCIIEFTIKFTFFTIDYIKPYLKRIQIPIITTMTMTEQFEQPVHFTLRLKQETADKHKELDTHPYIKKMYNNTQDEYTTKINLKYYLDLHCILLDVIDLEMKKCPSYPVFIDEFNEGKMYKEMTTVKLTNLNTVKHLINNISQDNIMAYCYAFYLGILFGGQIIKKLINKTNDKTLINQAEMLFDFNYDKKFLISDLKNYLDKNIQDQDAFINEVNTIYELTKNVFTDFDFKKC